MELSFSEVERLILFNQYTILAEIARIQDTISDADVYDKKAKIISGDISTNMIYFFKILVYKWIMRNVRIFGTY